MGKKQIKSIELTLPKIVEVIDYHEFDNIVEYVETLTGKRIKYYELSEYDDQYDMPHNVALFYVGKLPTKKEINLMLSEEFEKL